jgi:ubiquinone/menaquinone biosynthesis C-methylase UbiE
MPRNGGAPRKTRTQRLYDRIADIQHLALKLNGYQSSIAKYLRSVDLDITSDPLILDAGSGTGLITLAVQDAGFNARSIVSLDLSAISLQILKDECSKRKNTHGNAVPVQGDVLDMPFADETFDAIVMCGVLEYTPLEQGLQEVARVLKQRSPLVLLPVRPSFVGSILEVLYSFKTLRIEDVSLAAGPYFNLVTNDRFPVIEPISWSKDILIYAKK